MHTVTVLMDGKAVSAALRERRLAFVRQVRRTAEAITINLRE